jgi:spore coat protein H
MRRRGVDKLRRDRRFAWLASVALVAMGCGELHRTTEIVTRDGGTLWQDAQVTDAGPPCGFDAHRWLVEGESLSVPLVCPSGRELDMQRVELIDPPEGMELDREHAEVRWTPWLDQAANYVVELQLDAHERGVLRLGVADRFEVPDNVPVLDALRYTHELGLPVFHLGTDRDINGDEYTPATLSVAGDAYAQVQAKYRGATSRHYAKRSFTLKFHKHAPFTDATRGFYETRRLVLTSTFDDDSQLRQRLAFELWNQLDDNHIAIKHFSAVVYLNGHYQGVYAVTDHLNDKFLESAGYPEDVNLYKARYHDANFRLTARNGKAKETLSAGYTKEEGDPEEDEDGAYDDLVELVSWIASASDDAFRTGMTERLAPDFENWFLLVSLIGATDTATKNYFLVHDARPDALDTRWHLAPWDFNASYGQDFKAQRRGPKANTIDHFATRTNELFARIDADAALRARFFARYRSALDNEASLELQQSTFERMADEVHAAALRDDLRWDEEQRAYFNMREEIATHDEEIAYLREWIPARWGVIAKELGSR